MTDAEKLGEIRQRWEKATPGPWRMLHAGGSVSSVTMQDVGRQIANVYDSFDWETKQRSPAQSKANAEAIAAAPTDIAWLLAMAGRAVEQRK